MWEYSHEGKQLENKRVFRQLQKTGKVCADVISGGTIFSNLQPARVLRSSTNFAW